MKGLEVFDRESIEKYKADWPDWEQRFSPVGKVRSIPVHEAAPAPAEKPVVRPRKWDIGKWKGGE